MEKLLESKSEKIIAKLNSDKSFTKAQTFEIVEKITKSLVIAKRNIEQNQKKSRIEADKIILNS